MLAVLALLLPSLVGVKGERGVRANPEGVVAFLTWPCDPHSSICHLVACLPGDPTGGEASLLLESLVLHIKME